MGRGKVLNEHEKELIAGLSQGGRTIRDIAARVQRSKNVVSNFLRAPLEFGRKKSPGRPQKLSPTDKRRLLRAASNETKDSNTLRQELGLSVASRSVNLPHAAQRPELPIQEDGVGSNDAAPSSRRP
ncbi:unnamed protein product [Chondrus crispus]|uniref:Tc3 transposase DNA binding domain-containing protein n=1 Tax=Chondrus crispus TaxID=2769 RepID=R7Q487_CHOCR|nr:unnamed protein product [Chondrus crispus]CDF33337.1 unnamed protein product [Chondrus crispus]|eukprot:XP_005713140.1 unnamed protein product [Chondrus crispus]